MVENVDGGGKRKIYMGDTSLFLAPGATALFIEGP